MNDDGIKQVTKKKAGSETGDNALIQIEQNKIVIKKTKQENNGAVLKRFCSENPNMQRLIDSLDLVLL